MSVKNIPSPLSLKGMARLRERMDDLSEALAYADAVSDVVRDMGRVDMVICALRDGIRLRGQLSIPVYCVRV